MTALSVETGPTLFSVIPATIPSGEAPELIGSKGVQVHLLAGQQAADRFVFRANDSLSGTARYVIRDFRQAEGDKIDLALIDADTTSGNNSFSFVGQSASFGTGELRYFYSGAKTIVQGNTDADSEPEFKLQLTGRIALLADDFHL